MKTYTFTFTEASCDADWTEFNNSCYKIFPNHSNIEECRADCRKEGGDIASIHSMEENDFIASFMEENVVWIAGSITEKDGNFSWLDGSDWDFEHWDISTAC